MKARIFIIHGSEIIRKGLLSILKMNFTIDITLLEKPTDLSKFNNLRYHQIVFILENSDMALYPILHLIKTNNRVKFICFSKSYPQNDASDQFVDCQIDLNIAPEELQELVVKFFQEKQGYLNQAADEGLTKREKDVLTLVALGYSNKTIAEKLFISIHTVISHRKNLTEKLGIKSISGLTVYAIINKLIDTDQININNLI